MSLRGSDGVFDPNPDSIQWNCTVQYIYLLQVSDWTSKNAWHFCAFLCDEVLSLSTKDKVQRLHFVDQTGHMGQLFAKKNKACQRGELSWVENKRRAELYKLQSEQNRDHLSQQPHPKQLKAMFLWSDTYKIALSSVALCQDEPPPSVDQDDMALCEAQVPAVSRNIV